MMSKLDTITFFVTLWVLGKHLFIMSLNFLLESDFWPADALRNFL